MKLNDTGSLDELRPPDPKSGEVDTAAGATTDPGAVGQLPRPHPRKVRADA